MNIRASLGLIGFLSCLAGCGSTVDIQPGSGSGQGGPGGSGNGGSGNGGSGNGSVTATGTGAATSTGTTTGTGGAPPTCTGSDECTIFNGPCTQGVCLRGICVSQPANDLGACDDGLFCTLDDTCKGGSCLGGSPLACPSMDTCNIGICDEGVKGCTTVPANDGAFCDDGDPCTTSSVCKQGSCLGMGIDCSSLDTDCTIGVCGMNGCESVSANDGGACDDGLFCTTGEKCMAGACGGGAPLSCAPPGGCAVSTCNEATDQCVSTPGNDGAACDDQNSCTAGSVCSGGMCSGGVPANEGLGCDDGSMCTTGDKCASGVCVGTSGTTVYLSEDFSDNSAGWALGPEWQIGFAKQSFGGTYGADPALDHTMTADNGVAGVVIGGNAATNLHPYRYLESPAFDTSAGGSVIFSYYRWLNSDYDPFMHNRVEVWNGSSWIVLWQTNEPPGVQDSPPTGTGWTYVQFDVSAFKNAAMKVRFGFDVASGGVFTIGSWNVDDVLVASAPCP